MKLISEIKKFFSTLWKYLKKSKIKEKIREGFKKTGVFPIIGNINENKLKNIKEATLESILQYNHKKIYIVIDTGGGDLIEAFKFYDFLKSLNIEIFGIVIGNCMSAGLIILAGCNNNKRFAFKHSEFLFHGSEMVISFKSLHTDLDKAFSDSLGNLKRAELQKNTILKENFKLSDEDYEQLTSDGEKHKKTISAEEAKKLGIIDKVIDKLPFLN